MKELFQSIIASVDPQPNREGLKKTPARASASMEFLTAGYQVDVEAIISKALFDAPSNDVVVVRDIEFYSLCEHHLLPFFGKCHVAYIPQSKIVGLSKIPRVVDAYSRRLQVQEQMTAQIAKAIFECVGAEGVCVISEVKHLCMMMRGIETQRASVKAISSFGTLKTDTALRSEVLRMLSSPE